MIFRASKEDILEKYGSDVEEALSERDEEEEFTVLDLEGFCCEIATIHNEVLYPI